MSFEPLLADLSVSPNWFVILTFALPSILSLIALVDCAIRPFRDNTHKILWILAILIAPVLGALAYVIAGRKMATGN